MAKYIDFEELKSSTDITDVFELLDLSMKEKGEQLRGECPACGGGERSLVVTPSKQAFYCFQRRRGGDVIALVAHVLNIPMRDAAEAIENGTVPENSNSSEESTVPGNSNSSGMEPLNYLKETHEALDRLGLSPETCLAFGAGYAPRGVLRGRLCIPIHDLTGQKLVGYCGRAITDDQSPILAFPKNLSPEQYVFNIHRAAAGELYSTNDPLDVLLYYENTGEMNMISFLHRPIVDNVVEFEKRA